MAGLTNYAEDALLNHVIGGTALAQPSGSHVKLHTGDPGEDATALASSETSRISASFGTPSSGVVENDAQVSWPSLSLGADETIAGLSVWDAATGGNPLFKGTVSGQLFQNGDRLDIDIGDLDLSLSGAFCTDLADKLLAHLFGGAAYAQPAGIWVKLHTGAPGSAAAANAAAETTRQQVGSWSTVSGGATDNAADLTWTAVAATETITHISLWDAATGGNPMFQFGLTTSKQLTAGQDARFAAGDLDLSLA